MRLLVTGATGHVGLAVARVAAARGVAVVAQHRAVPGPTVAGVEWVRAGLADAAAFGGGFDACIHCAAVSNEAYARPDPLAAVEANVGATAALLEAARVGGWRFVLVSTGSVFQMREDVVSPIMEDEVPCPGGVYASTKVAAEMMIGMYRRVYGMAAASVRISWVYGPPVASLSPTRGPIPSFVVRAIRGEAIDEGGGDFAASFTHVDDVAEGLLAAAKSRLLHGVYHLGHGVNFSAREVAEAVRAAVPGAAIRLGPGTEPWTRQTALRGPLAGERLKAETGFAPLVSLAAGVDSYAAWMRAAGAYAAMN